MEQEERRPSGIWVSCKNVAWPPGFIPPPGMDGGIAAEDVDFAVAEAWRIYKLK